MLLPLHSRRLNKNRAVGCPINYTAAGLSSPYRVPAASDIPSGISRDAYNAHILIGVGIVAYPGSLVDTAYEISFYNF